MPGSSWPASRLRRGLAIGSVQSGKTASMLGVVAKALDRGVNIVVVLGGTRVALWRQTFERAIDQLDGWRSGVEAERRKVRICLPRPELVAARQEIPALEDLYHEQQSLVARYLAKGRPLIAVVMKQCDHLIRFGAYLREVLRQSTERPLHMLVIDDEADDGSILDAEVEQRLDSESEQFKQIPRHVARLWAGRSDHHVTEREGLFATYLAYTATPQANIVQSDHNPLSPSHFVVALRTPYATGAVVSPRSPTFLEPEGLCRYYAGGEVFYRAISEGDGSLCVTSEAHDARGNPPADEVVRLRTQERLTTLETGLRAYFVAGAIRLLQSGRRLSMIRSLPPAPLDEVRSASPAPHTMLVHPSGSIEGQLLTARTIAAWSRDPHRVTDTPVEGEFLVDHTGRAMLDVDGLRRNIDDAPEQWIRWIDSFEASRRELATRLGGNGSPAILRSMWPDIRGLLVDEVLPHTRLRVINSDPNADDRPEFSAQACGDGKFRGAPDLYTIFVSGNVMARGLTLDGLATTVFLRDASAPVADTQMQMQRWFGYRGAYLHLCRVFLFRDQLVLFRSYHEDDEALRQEVTAEMNREAGAPSPIVLQGPRYRATAKIANLSAVPLCPGATPFVRILGTGACARRNLDVLAEFLEDGEWQPLDVAGTRRGLIRSKPLTMLQVANVLERLRYSNHDPDPATPIHDRWRALSAQLGLQPPVHPLFRPPQGTQPAGDAVPPNSCPYSIAAYLRLWSAALKCPARGLYPTDDHRTPWSMINLSDYASTAPLFNVGVRFGSAGPARHAVLRRYGTLCMDRGAHDGVLDATWGSRNPAQGADAYLGDQFFDYHHTRLKCMTSFGDAPKWRPRGHPGLVLFHVVRAEDTDSVAVGLAFPLGGPDRFSAHHPSRPERSSA